MIAVALLIGTPFFIVFGWLSDKIGRKPIIMAGFLLAALTYFPIFKAITHYANPGAGSGSGGVAGDRHRRPERMLVPVQADGHRDSPPPATSRSRRWWRVSVNYDNEAAPKGTVAQVKVGEQTIAANTPDFAEVLGQAITAHGYPPEPPTPARSTTS